MKNINILKKITLVSLLVYLFSCNGILLIGAYNQNVDDGIQAVSKDISTLFVQVKKNVDDGKDYSINPFKDSYVKIESEIESLKIITNGLPKYKLVYRQITLLDTIVQTLENDHKSGFVAPGITDKTLIKKSIDADKIPIEAALSAMLGLEDALKREKTSK